MYKWAMAVLGGVACILGAAVLFLQIQQHQSELQQETASPALPDTPLNVQAAETVYKSSCIACHGNDLEGKMGPNLQKVGGKLNDQQLYKLIQNGRAGMPAFKSTLKDEEIVNMAKWLAEKK
ncbi:cytochrome c550 [Paenibacillus mucilaginosus]|uniref:c-type cytochrome n=1 Tax=Paenibacillus mucilaginosus TaxID=61624 RepID=UPI003D1F0539